MPQPQVFELALDPLPKKNGDEMAEMAISMSVDANNCVTIVGNSGGRTYHGTLTLRSVEEGGGDECYVCDDNGGQCHWENPCQH